MALGGPRGDHHSVGNKTPASPNAAPPTQNSNQSRKKNRIDVKDVFNNDDDDDSTNNSKKRKLVPIGMYITALNYIYIGCCFTCPYLNFCGSDCCRLRRGEEEAKRRGSQER